MILGAVCEENVLQILLPNEEIKSILDDKIKTVLTNFLEKGPKLGGTELVY